MILFSWVPGCPKRFPDSSQLSTCFEVRNKNILFLTKLDLAHSLQTLCCNLRSKYRVHVVVLVLETVWLDNVLHVHVEENRADVEMDVDVDVLVLFAGNPVPLDSNNCFLAGGWAGH